MGRANIYKVTPKDATPKIGHEEWKLSATEI
jgi:hypothetical protein